jgi:hypothetical protein
MLGRLGRIVVGNKTPQMTQARMTQSGRGAVWQRALLERLSRLREQGAVDQDEFERLKREIFTAGT